MIAHKLPLTPHHELADINITEFGEFMAFFFDRVKFITFVISPSGWRSVGSVTADFSEGHHKEFCEFIDDDGFATAYVGKNYEPTQEIDQALSFIHQSKKTQARVIHSKSFYAQDVVRQVLFETLGIPDNGSALLVVSQGEPGHRVIISEKILELPTVSPDNLTIAVYSPSTFEFIIYDNPLAIHD